MEKSLLKDSVRQIKNTFKRFLSIVAIVLLGVGFFAGITATSPDMKDTIDTYFDDEDVMDIIADIQVGMQKTNGKSVVVPDRREAIRYCIEHAQLGDIIVLAGKGHEDYQEIKGVKYPMDERVLIQEVLKEMAEK